MRLGFWVITKFLAKSQKITLRIQIQTSESKEKVNKIKFLNKYKQKNY